MLVKGPIATSGGWRKSWIKFDLSGQNADLSGGATLSLALSVASATTFTVTIYALNAGFVPSSGILGTNWSETAITWNNAPGNDLADGTAMNTSQTTSLGSFTVASTTAAGTVFTQSFSLLSSFVQSDQTVTLMIGVTQVSNTPNLNLASSENTTYSKPQLQFSVIPEPRSGALVLIGLLGGLALHVRRNGRLLPG